MTWVKAQQYCREKYTDIATFESTDDISKVEPTSHGLSWIGLHDDPKSWKENMGNDTNSWRWSATGEPSRTGYQMWLASQPYNFKGKELCVAMISTGGWFDDNCQVLKNFVCYSGENSSE